MEVERGTNKGAGMRERERGITVSLYTEEVIQRETQSNTKVAICALV